MQAILQTLHDLQGVNGAIVADRNGRVLAYRADAEYGPGALRQVSRLIVTAIDSVHVLHEDWESVRVRFSEGNLLIRSLASAKQEETQGLTLSLLADGRLNLSFAGLALQIAVVKLRAMMQAGIPLPPSLKQ